MSLLRRSLMLVGLALLPALAIQVSNEWATRSMRAKEVHADVLQHARLAADDLNSLTEGARQLLLALAQVPAVQQGDALACNDLFRLVTREEPKYLNVAAADRDGNFMCSALPAAPGASVRDRYDFKAVETNSFTIGEYAIGMTASVPVLQLAQPLRREGKVTGIIWVALRLDRFQAHLEQRGVQPGGSIVVADRNGTILATVGSAGNRIGKRLPDRFMALATAPEAGTVRMDSLDGIPSIIGFVPVAAAPRPDFFISFGIDEETAFAAANQATARGLALIGIGIVLSILAAVFGSRRFLEKPINDLLDSAERWRRGDYDSRIAVSPSDAEFDRLSRAFNTMASAVAAREQDLIEARLQAERQAAELRQALDDKQVLFNEIHHRVKNNLQVISSLLRLHSTRVDPASRPVLEQSITRIQTMSLVHELLYRMDEPARIDFGQYLRTLCDTLREAYAVELDRISIDVDATSCRLDLNAATPLALLAGELIANALKHAFPDGRKGHIHVALEGGERCERLIVRDNGIGIPPEAAQKRSGLGLTLVNTLARQLRATIETARDGGTITTITLPPHDAGG